MHVTRLSESPFASLASELAEHGAMTNASAHRRRSMCVTGSPTRVHARHSSSSLTIVPAPSGHAACNEGRNRFAHGVHTTRTSHFFSMKMAASSASLIVATDPVAAIRMRVGCDDEDAGGAGGGAAGGAVVVVVVVVVVVGLSAMVAVLVARAPSAAASSCFCFCSACSVRILSSSTAVRSLVGMHPGMFARRSTPAKSKIRLTNPGSKFLKSGSAAQSSLKLCSYIRRGSCWCS
mmetsp:Transcript_6486/g.16920  ORF Transcript_6486/g.16920 Transcript_6486/m.16920 type:complete len:235 (+) Transcript_6486:160-864(+)